MRGADYVRAAGALDRAARLAALDPEVQKAAGRIHVRGHLEVAADPGTAWRARRHYGVAMRCDPQDAVLMLEAARAWAVLGDAEGALELTDEALRLEPLFLSAHLERVRLLGGQDRVDQARSALRTLERARAEALPLRAGTGRERILVRLDEEDLGRLRRLLAGHEEGEAYRQ